VVNPAAADAPQPAAAVGSNASATGEAVPPVDAIDATADATAVDGTEEVDGTAEMDAADAELLGELGRAIAEVDPVPERVFQAARLAITFRDPDGELAELVAISMAETAETGDGEPAGDDAHAPAGDADGGGGFGRAAGAVRSGEASEHGPLMLSFAGADMHIDLEVTRRGRMVDVVGQLVGTDGSDCTIEDADGRRNVELDGLGRFIVEGLRSGPIRLRCHSADGAPVTTAWTTV
jgi:hypothetical protein